MNIVLSFFILSISLNFGESITLNCKYTNNPKYGYTCIARNDDLISSKNDREITKLVGAHSHGKNDDDVKFFQTIVSQVKYFPEGLTNFFKNLEVIEIKSANLMEIGKEDFQQFGDKLRMLWLAGNNLKKIDVDLFEFNKNLEKIGLDSNKIEKINEKAFESLKNLQSLFLRWNLCTNDKDFAENNQAKVQMLIKNVEMKCKKALKVFIF
jgi:hypothetical protein